MDFKSFYESTTQTITVWHGGDLRDGFSETMSHKKGRWEYGPGLYMTTHYDTAKKYAKGSRKLYKLTIEKGTDISEVKLDVDVVKEFIDTYIIKSKRKLFNSWVDSKQKDNKIFAEFFVNYIINEDAVKSSDTNRLRLFLVENGIDYALVSNAYGWHEMMLVLFNPAKIVNKQVIKPTDKIEQYNLDPKFN